MLRSAAGKVVWVGRATVFLVGLAVILAVVLGVATTALAAVPGDPFKLGKINSVNRISQLVGTTASAMLRVDNNGSGPALDLKVGDPNADPASKTTPPMTVDSQARVANLHAAFADDALTSSYTNNADKLDNMDHTDFALALHQHDSRYYTESEVDTSLSGKANTNHLHDDRYYTENESDFRFVNETDHTKGAHDALNIDAETLDGMDSSEFAPRAVEQWHQVGATNEPGFQNGWINEGSFGASTTAFYKDPWGVVHLKGLVKSGTVGAPIFELPCGYGTSERQIHTTFSFNDVARVDILPATECSNGRHSALVVPVTGSNAWLALDGITFRAAGS